METIGVRSGFVRQRVRDALVCGGGDDVSVEESGECEEYGGA